MLGTKVKTNTSDPQIMRERIGLGQKGYFFPPDISSQPVFFSINMREFQSIGYRAVNTVRPKTIPANGYYFHLPIPVRGLNDSFAIKYNPLELGPLGGTGASVLQATEDPYSIVGNIGSGLYEAGRRVIGAAAGAVGDVIGVGAEASKAASSLGVGAITNPNLAAVFEGLNLRRHSFTWQMIASNPDEARRIQRMIVMLKKTALPTRQLSGNFVLNYPHIAYLYLVGPRNNGLITFSEKGCFVTDIDVSYGGQSYPSFFDDLGSLGDLLSPVEIVLTITFMERSIVTSEEVEVKD
jgi:hypothetical protein